ncbi:putative S-acyltransferase [Acorus gramineus]|uniref:S-acyltransferase n=1 Tax=Acorus gramineus TaxID=55184 RepID=A0AAV9BDS3_ACOGR|nr:putative S-acyltransferase [Acorus gramineus]
MARRHGWQLPTHPFQVAAITVFLLLSIAFYAFLAPFLGKDLYEYVADSIYSVLVLSVCILYIRCTAIDPADPAILNNCDETSVYNKTASIEEEPSKMGLRTPGRSVKRNSLSCANIGSFFCGFMAREDCREYVDDASDDEGLFCSLCNTEVDMHSKHCRACDKCVYGFDHHCRWMNNCVARKNYITFFTLMIVSLVWVCLTLAVSSLQAISTAFSLMASVPLAELFLFHMLLIRKGMTTYEYVLAMRAAEEGVPVDHSVDVDQHHSGPSSPLSSAATAISGGSPRGPQYKGAWCTPPRIFIEQDETTTHLDPRRAPSTLDPDSTAPSDAAKKPPKSAVRLSAWKLAKLDASDATRAAARARASSSVLRPIINPRTPDRPSHCSSSDNSRSAVYWDKEAGRFVSGMARSSASSSRMGVQPELMFTGQSIFFGGPLLGERGSSSSLGRGRGGSTYQHPVFVPREQQRMP